MPDCTQLPRPKHSVPHLGNIPCNMRSRGLLLHRALDVRHQVPRHARATHGQACMAWNTMVVWDARGTKLPAVWCGIPGYLRMLTAMCSAVDRSGGA